jgi:hypothetical protein
MSFRVTNIQYISANRKTKVSGLGRTPSRALACQFIVVMLSKWSLLE